MIRAIFKNKHRDPGTGAEWITMETLDFNCPELERALKRGGLESGGMSGYHVVELIGVEVRP